MKLLPFLALLATLTAPAADQQQDDPSPPPTTGENEPRDPKLVKALEQLEKHLGVEFKTPFPENFDVDGYMKRPIAIVTLQGSKIAMTRPIVNPFDEPRTVEWMFGPADMAKFAHGSVDCRLYFNEDGQITGMNLLADWAADATGNHQIEGREGESETEFIDRAIAIYLERAKKAGEPKAAEQFVEAMRTISIAVRNLRRAQG